jgi:hypothetical protein
MERRCRRGSAANFIKVMYDHVLEVDHDEGSLLAQGINKVITEGDKILR